MPPKPSSLGQFWQELKRRKVVRVITVYAAAAFVILELTDIVAPSLGLPDWTLNFIIILLCIGFIITVIVSWVYDLTPEGIEKTKPVEQIKEPGKPTGSVVWKIATYISVVIILMFVIFYIVKTREHAAVINDAEKTIAVLPFENMSDDSEFDHLGDALTDEIIMQLYKIKEFEVRSRTSVMPYKFTEKGSPLIGEELRVNYLLEGSAQRYEDQVRIRIQLIHASTDDHIWGDIYEGEWEDIFDIQINVAKQVAHELKTVLSNEEIEQIEKNPTHNADAYSLYLKAHHFQNKISEEGFKKAIEYYQEAILLDPDYAIAYAGLAQSYALQIAFGHFSDQENLQKVEEAAIKSQDIDGELSETHAALGLLGWLENDLSRAEHELKLATQINPNYVDTHQWYSHVLATLGRTDEAIREAKIAQKLDPLNPIIMNRLGYVYFFGREYDLAIKECNNALEIDPDQSSSYLVLYYVYCMKGMYDDAIKTIEKRLINLEKEHIATSIRKTYEESGFAKAIRQLLDFSMEISTGFGNNPHDKSMLFASIGDTDKAFEWFEKAYERRRSVLNAFRVDPIFDSVRSDPRFQDLLERMDYPD